MIENRRFYWIKMPILSVECKNADGECPLTKIIAKAGAEYRCMRGADGEKNVWFDYFPHKAPDINEDVVIRELIAACKQCHSLQKAR